MAKTCLMWQSAQSFCYSSHLSDLFIAEKPCVANHKPNRNPNTLCPVQQRVCMAMAKRFISTYNERFLHRHFLLVFLLHPGYIFSVIGWTEKIARKNAVSWCFSKMWNFLNRWKWPTLPKIRGTFSCAPCSHFPFLSHGKSYTYYICKHSPSQVCSRHIVS